MRFVLAPALALSLSLISAGAEAFCRSTTCSANCPRDEQTNCKLTGAPLYWPSLCVGFSLNAQASEYIPFAKFREVIHRSVASWSSLKCPKGEASIAFAELPAVGCHRAEYNPKGGNANVLLFQDYRWDYKGIDNTLAKTTVTFDATSGEILDADIEFNHANNEFTTGNDKVRYDLESIATHELGHFLGLDHSDDAAATMNQSYTPKTIDLRTLEGDDIAGACTIYTPKRPGVCALNPRGGFADCANEPEERGGCAVAVPAAKPFAAYLVVGCLLAAARRRRRSCGWRE